MGEKKSASEASGDVVWGVKGGGARRREGRVGLINFPALERGPLSERRAQKRI